MIPAPHNADVDLIIPLQLLALAGWATHELADAWWVKGGAGIKGRFTLGRRTVQGIQAYIEDTDGELVARVGGDAPFKVSFGLDGRLVRS